MLKHNVRHLIVIDDEAADISKPIGIVTSLDLMKYEEYTRDDERKDVLEMILEYCI
jgi:CBS domain-containing protein